MTDENGPAEPVELTLADIAGQLDLVGKIGASLLLLVSGYPFERDWLLSLVRASGIQCDESQAFRPRQIVVPGGIVGGKAH